MSFPFHAALNVTLQLLVARLSIFKDLSAKIAAEDPKQRCNPGHSTTTSQAQNILAVENPSKTHYYDFLLETCEQLFDNEIDQHAFEEHMRAVFGIKVSAAAMVA